MYKYTDSYKDFFLSRVDFVSVIQPSYTFRPPPFYICFIYTPSILIPFKLPTENLTTNISTSHLKEKGMMTTLWNFVLFPCPHLFFSNNFLYNSTKTTLVSHVKSSSGTCMKHGRFQLIQNTILDSLRFVGSFQPSAIVLYFISRLSSYIISYPSVYILYIFHPLFEETFIDTRVLRISTHSPQTTHPSTIFILQFTTVS